MASITSMSDQTFGEALRINRSPKDIQVKLLSNHLHVRFNPTMVIYQYGVFLYPSTPIHQHLFNDVMGNHFKRNGGSVHFAGSCFFTSMGFSPTPPFEFMWTGQNISIRGRITFQGILRPGTVEHAQFHANIVQATISAMGLRFMGEEFCYPLALCFDQLKLLKSVYVKPGINKHGNLMVSVEPSNTIVDTLTVWQYIQALAIANEHITRNLVHKTVVTMYDWHLYLITGLEIFLSPMARIPHNGRVITVADYFWEIGVIKIQDLNQPLLVAIDLLPYRLYGVVSVVYLIPELSHFVGLTDAMLCAPGVDEILVVYMELAPTEHVDHLRMLSTTIKRSPEAQDKLADWQIPTQRRFKMMRCRGHSMPKQVLLFGAKLGVGGAPRTTEVNVGPNNEWGDHVQGHKMLHPAPVTDWAIILPVSEHHRVWNLLTELSSAASQRGFTLSQPCKILTVRDPNQLRLYLDQMHLLFSRTPVVKMVLVIFDEISLSKIAYEVSKELTVRYGVLCQGMTVQSLREREALKRAALGAVTKMSIKMGGVPWQVGTCFREVMAIALDMTHGIDDAGNLIFICALVASIDYSWSKYYSKIVKFRDPGELKHILHYTLRSCAKEYQAHNAGRLAPFVIFYRNGVHNEQSLAVINSLELVVIKETLEQYYAGFKQPLDFAYIVINEQKHTRVWTPRPYENPPLGLAIDSGITFTRKCDFYLISAPPFDGTAAPAYYEVLFSSLGFTLYNLEALTYKMCHMYFGMIVVDDYVKAGTVPIPAPAQYARRLLFCYGGLPTGLDHNAHPNLACSLHFL